LTNGSHCAIIFLKNRDRFLTGTRAGKKGAFQYALSSRKYWNLLEFSPLFGVKGATVFLSVTASCARKNGTICPKNAQKRLVLPARTRYYGRALTMIALQVGGVSDKQSGVTSHGKPAAAPFCPCSRRQRQRGLAPLGLCLANRIVFEKRRLQRRLTKYGKEADQ